MLKSNTEENLSRIRHRNEHRKSLLLDNDYSSGEEKGDAVVSPIKPASHVSTKDSPNDSSSGTQSPSDLVPSNGLPSNVSRVKVVADIPNSISPSIVSSKVDLTLAESSHVEDKHELRPVTSASVVPNYSIEQVSSTIYEIHRTRPSRLNNKDPTPDSQYVSRFRDAKFAGDTATIFDSPRFKASDGFGVYVLFWLGTAFLLLNNLVKYSLNGNNGVFLPVWNWPIVKILRRDLFKVGLTDLFMYLSTYFSFVIQRAVQLKYISWNGSGWWIQSIYTAFFFVFWMVWAGDRVMNFPWIAKVFLVLHSLVFVMKMHSYAFYNGYLWKCYRECQFSESLLQRLDDPEVASHYDDPESMRNILKESVQFCRFELDYQSKVNTGGTTASGDPGSPAAVKPVHFPHNLTVRNFFEYSMFPTVVYSLNFPRTNKIRWNFVFEKVAGTFGIIFLMVSVAQGWLYPLVMQGMHARELPLYERATNYSLILLDIIPPFLMIYLLTFFLIWDAILNAIGELSRYAERDFYGAWWSCTDWSEFSRFWNIPVHKFLLRHVYHSSISAFNLNKIQASLFTFMLSSVVHELVMYVVFGKLRGYLLLLQMSQLPLTMITKTRYMRDKKALGNVICWFGFISGPSMICTLYVVW